MTINVAQLHKQADAGDANAQCKLGFMHYYGQSVPQDYAEAAKWYKLAAHAGLAKAQNHLGNIYYEGKGVPQNYAEAVKWWRLAADQGDDWAQYSLGWMYQLGHIYQEGESVPQNYAKALKWYQLAAEQGHAEAQYQLGHIYQEGDGVPQDYAEAAKWYQLAAEQGHAEAQYCLEYMMDCKKQKKNILSELNALITAHDAVVDAACDYREGEYVVHNTKDSYTGAGYDSDHEIDSEALDDAETAFEAACDALAAELKTFTGGTE